jgi:predicted AAA+ superfamily ATPase
LYNTQPCYHLKIARFGPSENLLSDQIGVGLRQGVLSFREGNLAGILENIVFHELQVWGYFVSIGKAGDYEVDFIAEKNSRTVIINRKKSASWINYRILRKTLYHLLKRLF